MILWTFEFQIRIQIFNFSVSDMLYGLVSSFLISCIIYFIYEKRYRYWDSLRIFAVVSILLILNGNALYIISGCIQLFFIWSSLVCLGKVPQESTLSLQQTVTQKTPFSKSNASIYNYESDFLNTMLYGYENKTKEERAKLNDAMSAGDGKQIITYPCTKQPTNSTRELRCLSVSPWKRFLQNMCFRSSTKRARTILFWWWVIVILEMRWIPFWMLVEMSFRKSTARGYPVGCVKVEFGS